MRSFYETARMGSLSAAAAFLGMSQPTVSQQVHALERQLGDQLVEPCGRGSRLTEAGTLLAELVGPAVQSITSLKQAYHEARGQLRPRLTVAASPRIVSEDLPECLRAFTQGHPRVQLTLREYRRDQIPAAVEAGEIDLGFTGTHSTRDGDPWADSPWLECEPWYELDTVLITPRGHPLARKRSVHPRDLVGYPLLNGPAGVPDQSAQGILDKLGVFRAQSSCIEATLAAAIYRYVELGFGIGLTGRPPGRPVPARTWPEVEVVQALGLDMPQGESDGRHCEHQHLWSQATPASGQGFRCEERGIAARIRESRPSDGGFPCLLRAASTGSLSVRATLKTRSRMSSRRGRSRCSWRPAGATRSGTRRGMTGRTHGGQDGRPLDDWLTRESEGWGTVSELGRTPQVWFRGSRAPPRPQSYLDLLILFAA